MGSSRHTCLTCLPITHIIKKSIEIYLGLLTNNMLYTVWPHADVAKIPQLGLPSVWKIYITEWKEPKMVISDDKNLHFQPFTFASLRHLPQFGQLQVELFPGDRTKPILWCIKQIPHGRSPNVTLDLATSHSFQQVLFAKIHLLKSMNLWTMRQNT